MIQMPPAPFAGATDFRLAGQAGGFSQVQPQPQARLEIATFTVPDGNDLAGPRPPKALTFTYILSAGWAGIADPSQTWFWASDWQAGEREAAEDIANGRLIQFASEDDFLSSI